MGPYGINLPHVHSRAIEINFSVDGDFDVDVFQENDGPFILNELHKNQVAGFPKIFFYDLHKIIRSELRNVKNVVVYKHLNRIFS